jgi:hypothetical protein
LAGDPERKGEGTTQGEQATENRGTNTLQTSRPFIIVSKQLNTRLFGKPGRMMLVMCTCQSVNRQCLVSIFHSSSGTVSSNSVSISIWQNTDHNSVICVQGIHL